ncbi:MAG: methyl-accepting chemotaxis protein [Pseudomonadota bacterium]
MFSKLFGRKVQDETATRAHTLARIVDESETAFMMVDRDFNVTYMNEASQKLLGEHRQIFAKRWPGFDPDQMIGSCIDRFHTDPSHQRRMLAQPLTQPFITEIAIDDVTLSLRVTPAFDEQGTHTGSTLEWKDVTAEKVQKQRDADFRSQLEAVDRSQARIEFDLNRKILHANDNFLKTMGYSVDEVIGQDHKMFVSEEYFASTEYTDLWNKVRSGEAVVGEFKRQSKSGRDVWLQAAYAPVFDDSGSVMKVVKIASNITEQRELQGAVQQLLNETQSVMQQVSDGDLTVRIDNSYDGSLGDLKAAVNNTLSELNRTIGSIYRVADTVGTGASEISTGNADLSQRTEQQASSLERTAASMTEMTQTVQQNAANADEANKLAMETRDQAVSGGEVAERATTAMGEIFAASKKISDIIGVIDEIAFQTNLLALNASVEAARAGEQGRGFAVVASEVRNLAGRSATAAKEIKDLIEDSTRKVNEGSTLVTQSGETLNDIVQRVQKVTEIVGSIAAASSEQSEGISQVNGAIGQMDDLTQQNAALVEEVAAASQSLNQEASNLSQLVRKFTVSAGTSLAIDEAPSGEPIKSPVKKPFVERRAADRPWTPPSDEQITADLGAEEDAELWEAF